MYRPKYKLVEPWGGGPLRIPFYFPYQIQDAIVNSPVRNQPISGIEKREPYTTM